MFHLFFPHYCPVCATPTREPSLCTTCEPLLFNIRESTLTGTTIPLLSCGAYANPYWRISIRSGKFFGEHALLHTLTTTIGQRTCIADYVRDALLVPIPLHPHRYIERGYNQADSIARALASLHPGTRAARMLTRTGTSAPQSQQKTITAKEHSRFSFTCTPSSLPRSTRIILIDDVSTSGTTLRRACATLRSSGYHNLRCFVLCTG